MHWRSSENPSFERQSLEGFVDKPFVFLGAGGERRKKEALVRRAVCSCGRSRSVGRWLQKEAKPGHQVGGGAPKLGRRCAATARDLFAWGVGLEFHLNAWSSRK